MKSKKKSLYSPHHFAEESNGGGGGLGRETIELKYASPPPVSPAHEETMTFSTAVVEKEKEATQEFTPVAATPTEGAFVLCVYILL